MGCGRVTTIRIREPRQRIAAGLSYGESPRWHDGLLWLSDVHNYRVVALDQDAKPQFVYQVPGRPGGLGFRRDGSAVVASATDRRLCVLGEDGAREWINLEDTASGPLNDLIVDRHDAVWVGDCGFSFHAGEPQRPGSLIRVDADGNVEVVASDLDFPNGLGITATGDRLIVAETYGQRLTWFHLHGSRTLGSRICTIPLQGTPDGLCVDAEDHVWVAMTTLGEFHRVSASGDVTAVVDVAPARAVACVLGGEDRQTLYCCVAWTDTERLRRGDSTSEVWAFRVDVPGGGVP